MILHYLSAGVPTSWILTAVYRDAYGVARCAAETWMEKNQIPSFIVEVDDKSKQAVRKDLFWPNDQDHFVKPDHPPLLQHARFPVEICETLERIVAEALRQSLIEIGYLVSESEWRRRRPSDALTTDLFAQYFAADEAAREAGEELAFNPRFAFVMPIPEGHVLPYDFVDGVTVPVGGSAPLTPELSAMPDQMQVCRLLNSGWTLEEALIHLGPDQID